MSSVEEGVQPLAPQVLQDPGIPARLSLHLHGLPEALRSRLGPPPGKKYGHWNIWEAQASSNVGQQAVALL